MASADFAVEVWGKGALFTQPQAKIEKQTYSVITPSAASGLLKSIYWHPGLEYIIDAIQVCNPIQYGTIRVNGTTQVANISTIKKHMDNPANLDACCILPARSRQQMFMVYLKDVRYIIHGHIFLNPNSGQPNMSLDKAIDILNIRLRNGQNWSQPFLGCREFTAHIKPYEPGYLSFEECNPLLLGYTQLEPMLHFIEYRESTAVMPHFYRPAMIDGVIQVPNPQLWEKAVMNA